MATQPESGVPNTRAVETRIHDAAQSLRGSRSVGPEVKNALAELLDELSVLLRAPNAPTQEVAQLAESAAHLAQALHNERDEGIVEKARERLGEAVFHAESHAPTAVALARSVIDALANIGI
jgi:Domain of unknown function (DUF4404)